MKPTTAQIAAVFKALRAAADKSGYGMWISDSMLQQLAEPVAEAVLNAPHPE